MEEDEKSPGCHSTPSFIHENDEPDEQSTPTHPQPYPYLQPLSTSPFLKLRSSIQHDQVSYMHPPNILKLLQNEQVQDHCTPLAHVPLPNIHNKNPSPHTGLTECTLPPPSPLSSSMFRGIDARLQSNCENIAFNLHEKRNGDLDEPKNPSDRINLEESTQENEKRRGRYYDVEIENNAAMWWENELGERDSWGTVVDDLTAFFAANNISEGKMDTGAYLERQSRGSDESRTVGHDKTIRVSGNAMTTQPSRRDNDTRQYQFSMPRPCSQLFTNARLTSDHFRGGTSTPKQEGSMRSTPEIRPEDDSDISSFYDPPSDFDTDRNRDDDSFTAPFSSFPSPISEGIEDGDTGNSPIPPEISHGTQGCGYKPRVYEDHDEWQQPNSALSSRSPPTTDYLDNEGCQKQLWKIHSNLPGGATSPARVTKQDNARPNPRSPQSSKRSTASKTSTQDEFTNSPLSSSSIMHAISSSILPSLPPTSKGRWKGGSRAYGKDLESQYVRERYPCRGEVSKASREGKYTDFLQCETQKNIEQDVLYAVKGAEGQDATPSQVKPCRNFRSNHVGEHTLQTPLPSNRAGGKVNYQHLTLSPDNYEPWDLYQGSFKEVIPEDPRSGMKNLGDITTTTITLDYPISNFRGRADHPADQKTPVQQQPSKFNGDETEYDDDSDVEAADKRRTFLRRWWDKEWERIKNEGVVAGQGIPHKDMPKTTEEIRAVIEPEAVRKGFTIDEIANMVECVLQDMTKKSELQPPPPTRDLSIVPHRWSHSPSAMKRVGRQVNKVFKSMLAVPIDPDRKPWSRPASPASEKREKRPPVAVSFGPMVVGAALVPQSRIVNPSRRRDARIRIPSSNQKGKQKQSEGRAMQPNISDP